MAQEYASEQPPGFRNRVERVAVVGVGLGFYSLTPNSPCSDRKEGRKGLQAADLRPEQAGGRVGKFIAEELIRAGKHAVTAITRADSTSSMPAGAQVKKIVYDDQASLVAALQGQDALVITMGTRAPKEQQTRLIEAAAAADVRWVFPNEYGFDKVHPGLLDDVPIGEEHAEYTGLIERLGRSAWIGITCSFWYEYSLAAGPRTFGFDIPNRAVTFFDDGRTRINTSTLPQCARTVANLLALPVLPNDVRDNRPCLSHYRNRYVYVSSFNICQRDMLDSVARVTGTVAADWTVTHEPSPDRYRAGVEEMQGGNFLGFAQLMYTRLFYPNGGGEYETSRGLENRVLGLPEEDLDEFTKSAVERVMTHGPILGS